MYYAIYIKDDRCSEIKLKIDLYEDIEDFVEPQYFRGFTDGRNFFDDLKDDKVLIIKGEIIIPNRGKNKNNNEVRNETNNNGL